MSKVDMSKREVSRRLRTVAEVSDLTTSRRLATKVDMSASAVSRRLRQVAELRKLCLSLSAK